MQARFLIIGQGLAGSFLSRGLMEAEESFIVIDDGRTNAASRVAAGIINPVTGRRIVRTWMIETLMPFAVESYRRFGAALDIEAIQEKTMIDFFPSAQMRDAFLKRITEDDAFLRLPGDENRFAHSFRYDFGYGEIAPCYAVALNRLLPAWRNVLTQRQALLEETFDTRDLQVHDDRIVYRDITAEKIILCDGPFSPSNPWFGMLPFAPNKGEALVIRCPGLEGRELYKKGLLLAHLDGDLFWAGTSYEWDFHDDRPSAGFRERTIAQLRQWLKHDFTVEDHLASLRPATIERRPFVGIHPHFPAIGILNGMGTKGCSLAPWFSGQLVSHLTKNTPILPEADVSRFRRILDPANIK